MPRSTPTMLALPPFSGATRRLILILLAVFFADALLGLIVPGRFYVPFLSHLVLSPIDVVHGQLWQLGTCIFLPMGIAGSLFALLTLWFVGAMLEDIRGSRWLLELFLASGIGGAILASAISFTHVFHLSPYSIGFGCYPALFGLLIAVAVLLGDTEFLLLFIVSIKAKYLVAIYILIQLALLLKTDDAFGALLQLCGALAGFLFLRFSPRRGLAFGLTERYYALRNDFYRAKRRRAARKFEVYMSKQGRTDLHFDKDGRYVDPDKDPPRREDGNRWMN